MAVQREHFSNLGRRKERFIKNRGAKKEAALADGLLEVQIKARCLGLALMVRVSCSSRT
jgi:hypothetical protein